MMGVCECKQPHVSADSLRCIICKRLLKSINMTATKPEPEKYYQATTERSHFQMTTSKEGLIVSVMSRGLNNESWQSLILNSEQIAALKGFINDIG